MLTDAECDAIIEATFNGLEGIEVHMLGGDGWSDRALIRAGWQARAGYAAPPREPTADMLIAAADALTNMSPRRFDVSTPTITKIYQALWDAAPALPVAQPVAWRYRWNDNGRTGEWKFVPTEGDCNLLPAFERQPVYAAPVDREGDTGDADGK